MSPVARTAVRPPVIAPAAVHVERRGNLRRTEDRAIYAALSFTGRAALILAGPGPAGDRLAELLAFIARMAGARRAAVLVPRPQRRLAVVVGAGEPPGAALELAAWLDAGTPRSRAERATAGPAPVAIVVLPTGRAGVGGPRPRTPARGAVAGEGPDGLTLGFDFGGPRAAARLADRVPPPVVRQTSAMLAVIARVAADEREVSDLRRTDAERKRFVSTVAHELRAPMTGLAGYLSLLLKGSEADPADREEFLERSRRIVDTMAELVDDLLEVSRIGSEALDLEIGMVSLGDVLLAARDQLEPSAAAKPVGLSVRPVSRLRTAMGDRRRVEQAVVNLAGNAIKYTPPDGAVEIEAAFDGPVSLVFVRDTGPGIPPAEHERIFEPFARLDIHRSVTGTGLGLPIARDLARMMGGDIGVASAEGRGSTFVLALPGPTDPPSVVVGESLERALAAESLRLGVGRDSDGRPSTETAVVVVERDPGEPGEALGSPPPSAARGGVIHHRTDAPRSRG